MMLTYTVDWTRRSTNNGYAIVFADDHPKAWSTGYVYEHVLVVEQSLGRLLDDGEVVHHVDHDRMNNALTNLVVMTSAEHGRLHSAQRPAAEVELTCAFCKVDFVRLKRQSAAVKKYSASFCSRRCSGSMNGFKKRAPVP